MSLQKNRTLLFVASNPLTEIEAVRSGITTQQVELFLEESNLETADTLEDLKISRSTFFEKKKSKGKLNQEVTQKIFRLVHVLKLATRVLNTPANANLWLNKEIPSLNNKKPMDLLDTEPGHRLVEQALLQIEHGIYG